MENHIDIQLPFVIFEKFNEKKEEYERNFIQNNTLILNGLVEQRDNHKKKVLSSLDLDKLVAWHKELLEDAQRHKKDGHNFNVFSLLQNEIGIGIGETAHSKLLKFLLNPRASHGQDNIFLVEFLSLIGICDPGQGHWDVTAEKGRVDVMLQRREPHSVVIIENKSNWAVDQPNQLYRYWYENIFHHTKQSDKEFYKANSDKYVVIYLAPKAAKQPDGHTYTRPDYYQKELPDRMPVECQIETFDVFVQEWLETCIGKLPEQNHRVREYLMQYMNFCKKIRLNGQKVG